MKTPNIKLTISRQLVLLYKNKANNDRFISFFNSPGSRLLAAGDYNAKNTAWDSKVKVPAKEEYCIK